LVDSSGLDDVAKKKSNFKSRESYYTLLEQKGFVGVLYMKVYKKVI